MNYCSNCGFKMPTKSNFCSNCGGKKSQNKESDEILLPNILNENLLEEKYLILQKKISELIVKSGFLVVSIGDYFVQFQKEKDQSILLFDLGYLKNIPVNKLSEIYKLGFVNQRGSLNKEITLTNRKKGILIIVKETKYIFEGVFNCKSSEPFTFSEEYDDQLIALTSPTAGSKLITKANYSSKLLVEEDVKPSPSKSLSAKAIFFIIIIIIALIGYFSKSSSSSDNNVPKQDVVYNSPYDASVSQVETYLKQQYLKDPDSYESISWGKVVLYDDVNDNYMVRHKFRAKNGFGGYDVEDKVFYLNKDGSVIDVKDFVP